MHRLAFKISQHGISRGFATDAVDMKLIVIIGQCELQFVAGCYDFRNARIRLAQATNQRINAFNCLAEIFVSETINIRL